LKEVTRKPSPNPMDEMVAILKAQDPTVQLDARRVGVMRRYVEGVPGLDLRAARHAAEADVLSRALIETRGNISTAARLMGISRPALYDLLDKHQVPRRKR
jgi:two-component system NtrC family response regulator